MFEGHMRQIEGRFEEVNHLLATPEVATDPNLFRRYAREHARLEALVGAWRRFLQVERELPESEVLAREEGDAELRELAREEVEALRGERERLLEEIQLLLLPPDPNDDRNVLVEIRAGTGGDEASLFAADLLRMFVGYAARRGWKTEVLSEHQTDLGGFKEVVLLIEGDGAWRWLKHEGGVHRVQRVPETEAQGRIHTSACTVAIMPEADDVEVDVKDTDLKIEVTRAQGAGGQHVNKTESAVRIVHLPTGIVVQCQDERSQHKNKAKALKVLKAKLLEREQTAAQQQEADTRRAQVGSGDRSERIRTYNFPQNRVTDHRVGLTLYKLDQLIEGDMDDLLRPLTRQFQAEALASLRVT
jgi:peptide chain release factor 1